MTSEERVRELEREVAVLTESNRDYAANYTTVRERNEALEREVARLTAYAQHRPDCAKWTVSSITGRNNVLVPECPCTCGLG